MFSNTMNSFKGILLIGLMLIIGPCNVKKKMLSMLKMMLVFLISFQNST